MMEGAATRARARWRQRWPPKPCPIRGGRSISKRRRVRIDAALGAEIGFVERLVWFWSNHFCISADKIRSMSGAYEREAIRPHVLGRFTDMLLRGRGPSGHAVLSRQRGFDRARTRSPASTAAAASTRISPARFWSCIRWACGPATPRMTSSASPTCSPAGPCCRPATIPSMAANSPSIPACTSPARRRCWESLTRTRRWSRGAPCCAISPRIPRPPRMWQPSWPRYFMADTPPPAAGGADGEGFPR